MSEEKIDPAQQKIIDLLSQIASDKRGGKTEEAEARRNTNFKKNTRAIRDNGLALVGLHQGMLSLKSMIGKQLQMNQGLATALGQTGDAAKGISEATGRFLRGQQGAEQMVKVFKDAVDMGMTRFSDQTLRFGTQLKVLGIQNRTSFQLMRVNTEALGLAEEASLGLAQDLITTAIGNKDSISGLIGAINSMKDAMIDTTVELGPKAAMNAQKIAAMMSQGNSELQESSAKFVKSFLAGSDGYMKAAKLGVQFTGKESTAEMARKFETILGKIQGLQAGKQGAGSQFFFDAMERSLGLSREDFNLQTQIGTSIHALKEGNIKQLAQESASINAQQTFWNRTESLQTNISEGVGNTTTKLNEILTKIDGFNPTLGNYLVPILGGIVSLVGLLGLKSLGRVFWTPIKWLGKGLGRGLSGLGVVLANKIFGVKSAVMKTSGKTIHGAAAKGAVKKGSAVAIQKGFFKGLVKKIPIIGAIAGAGYAVSRAVKGDWTGAAMELASGVASTMPGLGTAASVGIDAGLIARDVANSPTGKVADSAGGTFAASMSEETAPMVAQAEQRAKSMDFGMSDAGQQALGSVTNALQENTTVLREILESNKESNNLNEDQLKIMSDDGGHTRIRAGRMAY